MPRYFFRAHANPPRIDEQGRVLSDDDAAWREAGRFAADMFKDINEKLRHGEQWSIEVTDEAKKPIYFIGISSRKMR
ncbi:hypothetical protein IVB33_30170 [Bradyrhizobium sp. 24]|uniref:DUF6894 family protein n=1 Tax=unclassified Bradyrhizobium TaxID=2631580 RepID=UPI001FF95022|nr:MULTISPECIES: hypothetical protein [unclassified Bradyrhizobium]MCK1303319.1 hypothetical protein [Bradyrhizobium sp. 37]MCK1381161.1 hypothetical protein [Bradyrhizobium sp. 24]MCK1772331.1 hypothetical protein [Bradyrhizobium sp. 134]